MVSYKVNPETIENVDTTNSDSFISERSTKIKKPYFEKGAPNNKRLGLSIRITIIVVIMLLVLLCSVFVWLSSFLSAQNGLNNFSGLVVKNVYEKVDDFLKNQFKPYMLLAKNIARDWNNRLVDDSNAKNYLTYRFQDYKSAGIGLMFGENNNSGLYSVFDSYSNGRTIYFWAYKPLDSYQITNISFLNLNDGSLKLYYSDWYDVAKQDYYISSKALFNRYPNLEGVFGAPYLVREGNVCVFYSYKVYERTLYKNGTKQFQGITKINLSLADIQTFLSSIQTFGNGYILVTEENNMVIGGSINTTTLDQKGRMSLFDIKDRGAGDLMRDIYNNNNFSSLPQSFSFTSSGVEYVISHNWFILDNLRWRVFIVMIKSEIMNAVIVSTGASVGVAAAWVVLGVLISIGIGVAITHPLKFLEKQFAKIRRFSLEDVESSSSIFKEVNTIYSHLDEMVLWLKEFKSFLPENVFLQLKKIDDENEEMSQNTAEYHESFVRKNSVSTANHSFSSSVNGKQAAHKQAKSLFKIGLQSKECTVINVKFIGLSEKDPIEITKQFSKIVVSFSSIAKSMQADIQIISVEEFQILFTENKSELKALIAALRISKSLDDWKTTSQVTIKYHIGISTGKANIGNLGTNNFRFYAVVGEVRKTSQKLSYLAHALNVKILLDESSFVEEKFIFRPVDIIKQEGKDNSQIVFELIKENIQQGDEWMYELEQKKDNEKFNDFQEAFNVLRLRKIQGSESKEDLMDSIKKSIDVIENHIQLVPSDEVIGRRILTVLEQILNSNCYEDMKRIANSYYSDISMSWKGLLHNQQVSSIPFTF
ncbi:hypothetical protein ABK040_016284 [Willaertia magna]